MGLIDDITANGKGQAVGIVGILAGVFVLGGFSFFHYVVQDDSLVGKGQTIESVLKEQAEDLADVKGKIAVTHRLIETAKAQAAAATQGTTELRATRESLDEKTKQLAGLNADLYKQTSLFDSYRQNYRAQTWKAAVGEKIPSLVLRSGRRYEAATITKVSASGMEITYADGMARISPADLDSKWRKRFDLEESGSAP